MMPFNHRPAQPRNFLRRVGFGWRVLVVAIFCACAAGCSKATREVEQAREPHATPRESSTTMAEPPGPPSKAERAPASTPPPEEEPPPPQDIPEEMPPFVEKAAPSTEEEPPIPEEKPEFVEEATPPAKPGPPAIDQSEPGVRKLGRVKMYYATDRKWTGARKQPKWFGDDWNDNEEHLTYGTCEVSIPVAVHKEGIVEKLSTFEILLGADEDPKKHVMVQTAERMQGPAFFNAFGAEVSRKNEKEVIVFIHGFNNTFDDAASRLAVLAYDMDFNGVPVLYSWSSQGGLLGWNPIAYLRDEKSIAKTTDALADFLSTVTQRARAAGARRISVVAHSMGNRALLVALSTLAKRKTDKVTIDEIVMAAPDVGQAEFAQKLWPSLQPLRPTVGPAQRVTLYASSDDKALWLSKGLHGGLGRIGDGRPLFLLTGLDTIDATGCDFTRFGLNHTYFGGGRVKADLVQIIQKGFAPLERKLRGEKLQQLSYWLLPEGSTR